ncbi:hypothetical protein [Halorubrum miltondacostae]|uniref:Uncharacterized protein n=1 Tax=Halorubrum miltondacostae TaxID=3076378 RepID=A0ABD5M7T7_9EURY
MSHEPATPTVRHPFEYQPNCRLIGSGGNPDYVVFELCAMLNPSDIYCSTFALKYRIPTPNNVSNPDIPAAKRPSCDTDPIQKLIPIAIAETTKRSTNSVVIKLPSSKRK